MALFPAPTKSWHSNTYEAISPSRPELSAKGKTVLVTGGGTGIGAETARSFAEAGASRIALLGRREQPLIETKTSIERDFAGVTVFVASTDVTKKSDVDSAFSAFVGDGKIDVLVHSAAVIGPQDPASDIDPDKFVDAVQVNLRGSLNVAQAFLRHAASDAVAIEVNSCAMHVNFAPAFVAYTVSKMAVYRLWDSIAFANPSLSVFHVQPGVVDTDMNKEAGGVKAIGAEDHVSLPASFHVWLASPEARFLKGKFLWSNWDVEELKARAQEIEATTQLNIGLVGWPFADGEWKFQVAQEGMWST